MERRISSKLLHKGRNFSFWSDEVELPSGRRTVRDVVHHPGAVALIPILKDGRIVLVSQYRYAIGKELLELPAGTLEIDEGPLQCARRELMEETGFDAGVLELILRCYVAPGYSSELIHFYVAKDLRKVLVAQDEDEEIIVKRYKLLELVKMIQNNSLEDAKTIIGILHYARSLSGFTA